MTLGTLGYAVSMQTIAVMPMGSGEFGVQVHEGEEVSNHRVDVSDAMLDELDVPTDDPTAVVRESFEFLLERVPPTSIPSVLSLEDLVREYREYPDEVRRRLTS